MKTQIPSDEYREIESMITSDSSPVGIDAKKTHVLILHKLAAIEARLARIDDQLESRSGDDAGRG